MKTPSHQKKLKAALGKQVRHLNRCVQLVSNVDTEVYKLSRDIFSTDDAVALWLTEPAPSLRGAIPLVLMRSERGRKSVAEALKKIAHGVP